LKFHIIVLSIMLLLPAIHAISGADGVISMEYFYSPPCSCSPEHLREAAKVDELLWKIKNEYQDQVRIEWIDATTSEGSDLMGQYNLTGTPTILVNGEYQISGEEITYEKLKSVIDGYLTGSYLAPEDKKTIGITAPLIIVSGLVDGVNPCAFALLVFFLSFLYSVHKTRGDILEIGGMYILSLFATYFAGGLGLLQAVTFFGVEHLFSQIGIILIILLGFLSIKDSLMPGSPSLEFSHRAVPKIKRLAERATMPASFVLGGLVGLCEFPCSGGVYVGVLALLAAQSTYLDGLAYLVLYNIVFVSPLILILLSASNRRTLARINRWNTERREGAKLISGVFMIVLGLVTWYWISV